MATVGGQRASSKGELLVFSERYGNVCREYVHGNDHNTSAGDITHDQAKQAVDEIVTLLEVIQNKLSLLFMFSITHPPHSATHTPTPLCHTHSN